MARRWARRWVRCWVRCWVKGRASDGPGAIPGAGTGLVRPACRRSGLQGGGRRQRAGGPGSARMRAGAAVAQRGATVGDVRWLLHALRHADRPDRELVVGGRHARGPAAVVVKLAVRPGPSGRQDPGNSAGRLPGRPRRRRAGAAPSSTRSTCSAVRTYPRPRWPRSSRRSPRYRGVTVAQHAVNVVGQQGIAVQQAHNGISQQLIFDPRNYAFIGEREVVVSKTPGLHGPGARLIGPSRAGRGRPARAAARHRVGATVGRSAPGPCFHG